MGAIIAGSPWLLELGMQGEPMKGIAGRILRAQILTASQRGHVLNLDGEVNRRLITNAAARKQIADVVVDCMACGWTAKLAWWVDAVDMSWERKTIWAAAIRKRGLKDSHAFLWRCNPRSFAEDTLVLTETMIQE